MQKKQIIQIAFLVLFLGLAAYLAIDMFFPSNAPAEQPQTMSSETTQTKVVPPPRQVNLSEIANTRSVIDSPELITSNTDFEKKLHELRMSSIEAAVAENKAAVREAQLRGVPTPEVEKSEPEPEVVEPYQYMGAPQQPAQFSYSASAEQESTAFDKAVLSYFDSATKQAYLQVSGSTYKAYPSLVIDDLKVVEINNEGVMISNGSKQRLLAGKHTYSLPEVVTHQEPTQDQDASE